MRSLRVAILAGTLVGWGLSGVAQAGTVTRSTTAIIYQAGAPAAAEDVTLGFEGGLVFVASVRGATTADCMQTDAARADCTPAPTVVVNFLESADTLRADTLPASAAVEARGGGGIDALSGAPGSDRLLGDDGDDTLDGKAGADVLDGGAGDDTIVGGGGQDQIAGGAGADTIDSRDGEIDAIDCGAGTDTALTDVGDTTTGCEIAPDFDGDGVGGLADCAPTDPAIGPGAAEIPGNAIDENCDGVVAPAPPPPPAAVTLPAVVVFTSSPKRVRVSRSGRFGYSFRATPGDSGTASLRSARSVRVGSGKRRLSVAAKSFTVSAAGSVKLTLRLSAASLRALRRVKRLDFTVRVVLRGATFRGKVTLLAPRTTQR